jgi:hypothetical protein
MASVQLHECCVVPYRVTSSGTEFCLLTPISENRWEFPKIRLDGTAEGNAAILEQAAHHAGLRGTFAADNPLGSYVATRQNESRSMIGYLMRVNEVDDAWPGVKTYRRLWCLAEEARVRIRRKPLRRFIDLALQCVSMRARGSEALQGQHGAD